MPFKTHAAIPVASLLDCRTPRGASRGCGKVSTAETFCLAPIDAEDATTRPGWIVRDRSLTLVSHKSACHDLPVHDLMTMNHDATIGP